MKIPCEECISFAICKQKDELICDILFYHMVANHSNLNSCDFWLLIRKVMPCVDRLVPVNPTLSPGLNK